MDNYKGLKTIENDISPHQNSILIMTSSLAMFPVVDYLVRGKNFSADLVNPCQHLYISMR